MATGRTPLRLIPPQFPEHGIVSIASVGSALFLCNRLASTVTTNDKPYNHFGGNSSYDANVLLLPVPRNALYLDTFCLMPGTTAPTTSCRAKGYGLSIGTGGGLDITRSESDQVPGRSGSTGTYFHPLTDLVVPLQDPVTGDYEQDYGATIRVTQPESGASLPTNVLNIAGWDAPSTTAFATFCQTGRKSFGVQGCDYAIVLISQACSITGSVIVGRFAS